MIYQGQKVLTRRWKYFPGPLPTLLLHGTDDPICSYQATALLSSQLLKRNPSNFIFRSWKCNRHDRKSIIVLAFVSHALSFLLPFARLTIILKKISTLGH